MRWTPHAIRQAVEDLETLYGRPSYAPRYDPLDELVSCILSQHTADANAFPVFDRLRRRYPEWKQLVRLSPQRLAMEIRSAGLANQKAKSILSALKEICKRNGDFTLEPLRKMPTEEARSWLLSLPGVGPKTAAIVLCFALGREVIPVDTHVFRVSWRLGIIDRAIGAAKAHHVIEKKVPPDLAYRFHVALIQHGRRTCRAPTPLCEACPLSDRCRWYRNNRATGSPKRRMRSRV